MTDEKSDEEIAGRDLSVVSQIPVTLGVWLLSDNRSLRESWHAVRTDDGE